MSRPESASSSSSTSSSAIFDPGGGRDRNGRPVQGVARGRDLAGGGGDVTLISFPFYGPWGTWYPWYGSGFGYSLGYVSYNPWFYGGTGWGYGRYGLWYDPFTYAYDPYSYGYGGYGGGGYSRSIDRDRDDRRMGSLRLKVKPSNAKVYVDGALAGVVDDFDGLGNHLDLEAGSHELELRADGYATRTVTVSVEADKTRTQRITLKKK